MASIKSLTGVWMGVVGESGWFDMFFIIRITNSAVHSLVATEEFKWADFFGRHITKQPYCLIGVATLSLGFDCNGLNGWGFAGLCRCTWLDGIS